MTSRGRRPRNWRVKWLLLALGVLSAFYLNRVWQKSRPVVYPANAFHTVKRGDLLVSVIEDGALRALNETIVRSGLEGMNRIIHLVPEGTHVKKGELLVELDSSGVRDRLNEQELAYQERLFQFNQAQGNLQIQKSLAESQIKDAELRVETAVAELEKFRDGDAPLLLRTVEARIGVIGEQVRIATERLARTEVLFKANNATRSELLADELSLKREQLALAQYQEDQRLVVKYDHPNQIRLLESRVQQARDDLARLRQRSANELAQTEADLKTSERTVAFLQESVETLRQRLDNALIYAPQDGLVVHAPVSQFQSFGGGDMRRDDNRFRTGGRGPGGGGGGEFRGGGRRGGSGTDGGFGGSSGGGGSAQSTVSSNQRLTSSSGTTQSGGGGGGGGTSLSSGGARGGGGGGGGGGGVSNPSSAFATYPSVRPSSTIPARTTAASSGTGSSGSSGTGSSVSSGSGMSSAGGGNAFGNRSQFSSMGSNADFSSSSGVIEEGLMVRQRQELIRLPDVSKMVAEIRIHESRVRQVRPGMVAYIRVENLPAQRFKGTVRRVAPLPDSQMSWLNPDVKVHATDILVEEELPELKPGVSARAEVIITNLSAVLTVPIHTVVPLRGENVCFVQRGGQVVPVAVTTGWSNDKFVEVTSGLKEGDLVLLAPIGDRNEDRETNNVETASVTPGQPVQSMPPVQAEPQIEDPAPERRFQRPEGAVEGDGAPAPRRERPQGGGGNRGRRPDRQQEVPE